MINQTKKEVMPYSIIKREYFDPLLMKVNHFKKGGKYEM